MVYNWETILLNAGVSLHAIDVGCSSGRPYQWERLGSALHYVGIDPLKNEVARLGNLKEPNSKYISGLLQIDGGSGSADAATMQFFNRTSAWKEMQSGYDQVAATFNSGLEVIVDETKVSVEDLMALLPFKRLDLLKIDIDSDDYLAMNQFFKSGFGAELLLLDIESQFHGNPDDKGNSLWNIGKLANQNNLHLYDLEVNRYSRSILPSKFIYGFPAQTQNGQALWGDALFIKDSIDVSLSLTDRVKLVALYEVYGLYDCALETIKTSEAALKELIPTDDLARSLIDSSNVRESRKNVDSILASCKAPVLKALNKLGLKND
jgi:hypothetical protein